MTHALVTGASGFIGGHLVRRLHERGHDVTCLVRSTSNRDQLAVFRPRYRIGDVSDASSLQLAVQDADVVYHLAGVTKCLRIADMEHVNVDGARNVARACANCSTPPTLIHVSSLAAAGPTTGNRLLVESDPPTPISHYGHSKLAGEFEAMRFADKVPITIVRPPIVLGEADRDGLSMFVSIARWNLHFVPGTTDEPFSAIHGDDLAEALILSAEHGHRLQTPDTSRGVYFASALETPTYAELGRMIGRTVGREHVRIIRIPKPAVWAIAAINEVISQIRRRPHILGLDKAREATAGAWVCDGTAIRRDTGFAPAYTLQERLNQTATWYGQQGWIKSFSQTELAH